MHPGLNRRDFLVQGAVATAALVGGRGLLRAAPEGPMVAIVRDKAQKAIDGNTVDAAVVRKLVDKAVMTLAGKDDVAKAWATYVKPSDKVAVKFNGLFQRATTHPEVVDAVTGSLIKAGVDPANIVVYDRADGDLPRAGLKPNREGPGPRMYATGNDYGKSEKAGPVDTKITNILHRADVLINLPVLKTHELCGISGALKNHLGTVPNAGDFHRDTCRYVADINALEPVKAKTRLCLCDALYGLYDGGPGYRPQFRWDYHGIVASCDPVALDIVLAEIIKAKRLEKGKSPYHKDIVHIERAAELALGCADLKSIRRVEMDV